MLAFCAWCEAEGKPEGEAFLGVREPANDRSRTHGICKPHRTAQLAEFMAGVEA